MRIGARKRPYGRLNARVDSPAVHDSKTLYSWTHKTRSVWDSCCHRALMRSRSPGISFWTQIFLSLRYVGALPESSKVIYSINIQRDLLRMNGAVCSILPCAPHCPWLSFQQWRDGETARIETLFQRASFFALRRTIPPRPVGNWDCSITDSSSVLSGRMFDPHLSESL